MDLSWRFDFWYRALPKSPRDEGRVRALVKRPPEGGSGAREIVDSAEFSPEVGMHGDRWSVDEERTGDDQISLVNIHVISAFADSPEERARCGDNLHVDLDLTEENLPVGSRLEIGSVVLEVSPQPHQPCKKFLDRFGQSAVKKVLRANRTGRRGRGVICMVVQAGWIRVGDAIRVSRAPSGAL